MALVAGSGGGFKKTSAPTSALPLYTILSKLNAAPTTTVKTIAPTTVARTTAPTTTVKAATTKAPTYSGSSYTAAAPVASKATVSTPVTTTVAAKPTAATPNYNYIDAAFKRYYDAVQQDFADRGLLDSTNKTQPLLDVADAYANKLAEVQRADTQNAYTNAMNLWELITSGKLSLASLTGSQNVSLPSQPSLFADIFNYQIPQYSSTGKTGDANTTSTTPYIHTDKGEVIPAYDQQITTLAYKNAQTDAANAAKSLAVQQAYLKLAQDQGAADAASATDTATTTEPTDWNTISGNILTAFQGGGDGNALVKEAYLLYGVDIVAEAKAGNARAQALLDAIGYKELDRTAPVGKFLDEKWSGILNNPRYMRGWPGSNTSSSNTPNASAAPHPGYLY